MRVSAVVDLDGLSFIVAYNQYSLGNTGDSEKVKNHVKDFISNILSVVGASEYLLFYQKIGHKNFRHSVVDNYKANRADETPEFLKCWGETIHEAFEEVGAVGLSIIESDDALSIIQKSYDYTKGKLVMCHNDKDILQCSGKHYNFSKREFKDVSIEEADLLYHQQLLTGDFTDNIMGCGKKVDKVCKKDGKLRKAGDVYQAREGVGPKGALKLLEGNNYPEVVINAFRNEFDEECWYQKLKETTQLIGLLKPDQQLEKFSTSFIPNEGLLVTNDLFKPGGTGIEDLFD